MQQAFVWAGGFLIAISAIFALARLMQQRPCKNNRHHSATLTPVFLDAGTTNTRLRVNDEYSWKQTPRDVEERKVGNQSGPPGMDWTSDEKREVISAAASIVSIPFVARALAKYPMSICKVTKTYEGGFPHTRAGDIYIPDSYPISSGLLLHEYLHVLQRWEPKQFESLYRAWGFTPARREDIIPKQYLDIVRINPDTADSAYYIWNKSLAPLPLYNGTGPLKVDYKFLDLNHGTLIDFTDNESFIKYFGYIGQRQPEHPNEIAAWAATYLLIDAGSVRTPAIVEFDKWQESAFS